MKIKIFYIVLATLCQMAGQCYGNLHSQYGTLLNPELHSIPNGGHTANKDTIAGAPIIIYLEISNFPLPQDTVVLDAIPYYLSRNVHNYKQTSYTQIGKAKSFFYGVSPTMDQVFHFETEPFTKPGYISLKNGGSHILKDFVVFPGDSIMIRVDNMNTLVSFAGPSSTSFQCQYEMAAAKATQSFLSPTKFITKSKEDFLGLNDYRSHYSEAKSSFGSYLDIIEEGEEQVSRFLEEVQMHWTDDPQWDLLMQYEGRLDKDLFEILKGDIIGGFYSKRIKTFNRELYSKFFSDQENDSYKALMTGYNEHVANLSLNDISEKAGTVSINYLEFLSEWVYAKAIVERLSMTAAVKAVFKGEIREKLLSQYLANHYNFISNKERYMDKANPAIVTTPWRFVFDEFYSKQKHGAVIEDFSFIDHSGKQWTKNNFKDQLVVFYFWFYGCGASANFFEYQIRELQDSFGDDPEVRIVTVSVDKSMDLWKSGLESGKYTDESTLNLHLPQSEALWLKNYNIISFPHLLIMDKDGRFIDWEPDEKNASGIKDIIKKSKNL